MAGRTWYLFASRTLCDALMPKIGLFVEHYYYNYERWHHSAAYSFEVGDYKWSLLACMTAIENGKRTGCDVSNDELNLIDIRAAMA